MNTSGPLENIYIYLHADLTPARAITHSKIPNMIVHKNKTVQNCKTQTNSQRRQSLYFQDVFKGKSDRFRSHS